MHFKDNEEKPKIHHKVFILNQESEFIITSPLKLMGEKLLSLPKLFVKNILNLELLKISKLLLSYQKFMNETDIYIKSNTYLFSNRG